MRHRQFTYESLVLCLSLSITALVPAVVRAEAGKGKPSASSPKASAKPKTAKTPAAASGPNKAAIDTAVRLMASGKHENVESGIQSLGLLGTKEAVEPLARRIRDGLPPDLLEAAIVTLMALGQPSAGPVLFELSAHRRPEVRIRAIEAIAATNPPGAEQALAAALSDTDTQVRSAAATGLGEIGASGAIEKLFLALDRGNMEASGAIGKSVAARDVTRLLEYLGKLPFRSMSAALAEVLKRTDVPEGGKLELVSRLEEVGTAEVKGFLGDVIAAGGGTLSPNLSRALLRAMQEIAN
jgi:HEAT repeat protein